MGLVAFRLSPVTTIRGPTVHAVSEVLNFETNPFSKLDLWQFAQGGRPVGIPAALAAKIL